MKTGRRLQLMALCATVLLAMAVTTPAAALTKQETHDEMIRLAHEMNGLKSQIGVDPAAGDAYADLRAQYDALSRSLGGDDPGRGLGGPAAVAADGPEVAPAAPAGCVTTTTPFTDAPATPIVDNATFASTLMVATGDTYLWDLDLTTDITHTFAGDLDITLTSPAGTVVTISTDNGAGNDDVFSGTLWDDTSGSAPTNFTYANLVTATPLTAEEALSAFIGEDPNGMWTLDIADDAAGDTGTLNSWTLDVTTSDVVPMVLFSSLPSTDTPLPIVDNTTTASSLSVAGAGTFLCDLDLTTDITHTFAADLEISLTSPVATVVAITTDNGGSNDDVFAGTLWDDGGGAANPPGPVTDNTFANLVTETPLVAEGALGAFIGEDPNGSWRLDVFDDAGLDVGTLNSWSLGVTTCVCMVAPPVPPVIEVPTQSRAGMIVLLLLLAGAGIFVLRRLTA